MGVAVGIGVGVGVGVEVGVGVAGWSVAPAEGVGELEALGALVGSGEAASAGPGNMARIRTAAAHIGTTEPRRENGLRCRPRTMNAPLVGLNLSDPINSPLFRSSTKPLPLGGQEDDSTRTTPWSRIVQPV